MKILDAHRQFIRHCALEEGLSALTLKAFKCSINVMIARTGVTRTSELSLSVVRGFFYDGLEKHHWSYWTYANHHKYLRRFFQWCVEQGYMADDPTRLIKKPRKPQVLPRRLSHEQAQQVLYASFNYSWRYDFERVRNHAIIATFLYTGIRASELRHLLISDLDLDAGTLFVRRGKGCKDRYVPVHHKLQRILVRYISERKRHGRKSPALFTGTLSDRPLSYKAVHRICRIISRDSGVRFTPHCLRHTFGSIAIEQDMGLVQLKEVMGHSNIASTMLYLKMSPQALRDSLNRLDLV